MAPVPDGAGQALSVAELIARLRRAVGGVTTSSEWVEGEITNLSRAASGHVYFALKDEHEDALIDCVMYRANAVRSARVLNDGARAALLGRPTVWAPRGRLQLVVERARLAGRGALLEALEKLKLKLAAEGLFRQDRKRALPKDPRVVGLVTSASGAAVHDFCRIAFRRGSPRIVLAPCRVQGDGAAATIIRAVDQLERYPALDLLVVGRGGGSGDDLMAFNDERLVRRLARVAVPVISAVGHEIDVSLSDLVADRRAATPSEAAEIAIPDRLGQQARIGDLQSRLVSAARARVQEDNLSVVSLEGKLEDPRHLIHDHQMRLDDLTRRLGGALHRRLRADRAACEHLRRGLAQSHPRAMISRQKARLTPLGGELSRAMKTRLAENDSRVTDFEQQLVGTTREQLSTRRQRLAGFTDRMDALSPLAVLGRGYAIALGEDGKALTQPSDLPPGSEFQVRLAGGSVRAVSRGPEVSE